MGSAGDVVNIVVTAAVTGLSYQDLIPGMVISVALAFASMACSTKT